MIVGRERELTLLTETVEAAGHGAAGSVVVRGEPGIGKTALLDEVVRLTEAATVLRTRGLEVEAPLPYAALHRLLRPLTRLLSQLPPPQARAMRMAFGEEDGPAVEPFLIGVATLTVLTAAAEEQLVLCVVDDAHWLDPATADALLFCARRIGADRVAMMFATRDGAADWFEDQDLAAITLTGLTSDAAQALLDAQVGTTLAEEVTQRLISETRGNPLALLELPTELSTAQLHGASPLPVQFHVTARLERVFLERSRSQPGEVRSFLLLAAADDTGDLVVLKSAAAHLGLTEQVWEAAVNSGLLEADTSAGAVSLRHPLVRSAIYQAATSAERRRIHLALADAFAAIGDADREVWQRSAAAEGPDDGVAAALEIVGSRAQRRGAHVSALAAFERAAALCADPARRAALTFAAARSAWACGQVGPARTFLATAEETATEPALLADMARLRGHIEVNLGSATLAHRIFVETANAVRGNDPQRALEVGVLAATLRTYGADSGSRLPAADLGAAAAGDSARTRCLKQMLAAMTLTAEGSWSGAVDALNQALAIGEEVDDREVLWNLGNAALQLGDDDAQLRFYSLALSRAREAGAVTAVIYALQRLCFSHYLAGDLIAVRSAAEEALSLGSGMGQPAVTAPPTAWLTLLAATQGSDTYEQLLRELEQAAASSSLGILTDPVHDLTRWAKGVRAASTGDRSGALHHLSRFRLPALSRMAAVERFDAAVRAEEAELVRGWADELASFAEATGRSWAFATAAYGRALTTEGTQADTFFQEALSQHERAGRPLDQARAQLAYGEWLRRAQRRVDARRHLRHALESFEDARVEALADRATQELRASGETARKRDPSTLVKLTPMELKIAQLVSSGLSNKDVAAQIWVSPRTVAFHLRNIFTKAGVTSRGALAQLDFA
ncbi:AAA family ATPase [Jatrophihabitans telluris]|uniref:AAA family ATPase n=1 Tax=Jatrophihabitans telluris TaxID=2038343 RepID=A0ABY4QUZ8_9ACTN|nr:helix-turn-helix transcriptional regulator [Jatrophihabitans telluris]UQX87077.1 AAA family ATPase [Jatrophihabitans telluris]